MPYWPYFCPLGAGNNLLSGGLVCDLLHFGVVEVGVHEDMLNTNAEGSVMHFQPIINPSQLLYDGHHATIIPNLLQLLYDGHYNTIMST